MHPRSDNSCWVLSTCERQSRLVGTPSLSTRLDPSTKFATPERPAVLWALERFSRFINFLNTLRLMAWATSGPSSFDLTLRRDTDHTGELVVNIVILNKRVRRSVLGTRRRKYCTAEAKITMAPASLLALCLIDEPCPAST